MTISHEQYCLALDRLVPAPAPGMQLTTREREELAEEKTRKADNLAKIKQQVRGRAEQEQGREEAVDE